VISDLAFGKRLYTIAVLGAMLYCVAAWSMGLALFVLVIAGVAAMLTRFGTGTPLPRLVINIMISLATLWTLRNLADGSLDVDDFSVFITLLVLIKLFDMRSPRDEAQILTLSVFLGLGAILTANALELAVLLVFMCPLLVSVVMQHQLRAGQWRARGRMIDEKPDSKRRSPAARRDMRRLTALVVASSFGISVVVFILFPRGLGDSAFGAWGNPAIRQQTTGFSDRVELGIGGLISESHTPVLDVQIQRMDGTVIGGDDDHFYLRGAVLDQYKHGGWRRSNTANRGQTPWRINETDFKIGRTASPDRKMSITLRNAGFQTHLFTEFMPLSISSKQGQKISWDLQDFQVKRKGQPGRFVYDVYSSTRRPTNRRSHDRNPVDPPDITGLHALAVEALGGEVEPDPALRSSDDDDVAARKIERWLQHNFTYSLETNAAPNAAADPTLWFLTESREGHCEYFASAMANMCRSIGINARVITGYVVAEWNPLSDQYVVRESNAHAWVEVEVGDDVWWPYDPTPPADLRTIHHPEPGPLATISSFFGAIENGWNSFIVGYDASLRAGILGTDPERPWGSQEAAIANWRRYKDGGGALFIRAALNGAIVFLLFTLIGLLSAVAVARRNARREASNVDDPKLRARLMQVHAYTDALESLTMLGLPKPPSATPLQHARWVLDRNEQAGTLFADVVTLFYRVRFGGRTLSDDERRSIDASAETLRQLVR